MRTVTWSAVAAACVVVLIATAAAAGAPPAGKGSGGTKETPGNNLSVPAIFVPSSSTAGAPALRLPCGAAQDPKGPQSPDYPGYWLQKTTATWTAACTGRSSIGGVTADWGDNLTSAGSLMADKPVRVELALLAPSSFAMRGYFVDKLTPNLEDRLSVYGTAGVRFTTGSGIAARVWDSAGHLTISPVVGGSVGPAIYDGPMTAEINSIGAVVYGYNWGSKGLASAPPPGTYRLAFTTSTATTLTAVADAAAINVPSFTAHRTEVTVTLTGIPEGGGGGGGGETGLGNNLSLPTVFVPRATAAGAPALRLPCGAAQGPSGPQSPDYPGYWLQNTEATWTAACTSESALGGVIADWSDGLTAPEETLTGGRPLRIEIGLLAPALVMRGYQVDNLTPTADDRLATYGTSGVQLTTGPGGPAAGVWDAGGHLTIRPIVDGVTGAAVYDGPMPASVSSSGSVVYGLTWGGEGGRVTAPPAGTYELIFSTSLATTIAGVADGAAVNVPTSTAHSTTLVLTLTGTTGSGSGQGGPPPGKGPGGGGETETLGNNLSVPAIFVPSLAGAPALRVACDDAPQAPGADGAAQSTDFAGFWLQKSEATWSASCSTAATAGGVTVDWGDNLTTAGSLAAGKPVRVEVGLLAPTAGLTGYTVTNLTPSVEDRLATYGTDGASFTTTAAAGPQSARVWDAGARLRIEQLDAAGEVTRTVLPEQAMTAEINSTGAVVYGYNWGSKGRASTPVAGTYRLTFKTSAATTITGIADTAGTYVPSFDEHSTTLVVTLGGTAGGGGEGEG